MAYKSIDLATSMDTSGVTGGVAAINSATAQIKTPTILADTKLLDKVLAKTKQIKDAQKDLAKPITIKVDEKGLTKSQAQLNRMMGDLDLGKAMEGKGAHWREYEKTRLDWQKKGKGAEFEQRFAPAKAALVAKDKQDQLKATSAKITAEKAKAYPKGEDEAKSVVSARQISRVGREVAGAAGAQFGPLYAMMTMGPQIALPIAAITYLGSKALPALKYAWDDISHTTIPAFGSSLHDADRWLTHLFDKRSTNSIGRMKDELANLDSELERLRDRGLRGTNQYSGLANQRFALAYRHGWAAMQQEREDNAPAATVQTVDQSKLQDQINFYSRVILAKRKSNAETQSELELMQLQTNLAHNRVDPVSIKAAEGVQKQKQQVEVARLALQGINTLKDEDEIRSELLRKGQVGNEYARELLAIEQRANHERAIGGKLTKTLVDEQEELARAAVKARREDRFQAEKEGIELGQNKPGLTGRMMEIQQQMRTGIINKDQAATLTNLEKQQIRINRQVNAVQSLHGIAQSTWEGTRTLPEKRQMDMSHLALAYQSKMIDSDTMWRGVRQIATRDKVNTDLAANSLGSAGAYSTWATAQNTQGDFQAQMNAGIQELVALMRQMAGPAKNLAGVAQNMRQAGNLPGVGDAILIGAGQL